MSYTKKQFAQKMIEEIEGMQKAGFVYQSVNSLSTLNRFVNIHYNTNLFKDKRFNTMLNNWQIHYAPNGTCWLNENKAKHLTMYKKKLVICPSELTKLAKKKINSLSGSDELFLKTSEKKTKAKKK